MAQYGPEYTRMKRNDLFVPGHSSFIPVHSGVSPTFSLTIVVRYSTFHSVPVLSIARNFQVYLGRGIG